MKIDRFEDVKDTAIELDRILKDSPDDYYYLKGYIHCLLQKEGRNGSIEQSKNLPKQTA